MMVFKRKQIVVLSLVLMIVVAGYLQYSYKKSSVTVGGNDNSKIGEAVYVESNDPTAKDQKDQKDQKDKTNQNKKDTKASSISASKQANDFFAQAKLDKEVTRSKEEDSLKAITEDTKVTKEAKAKAYDQMVKMIGNSEKEMKVETLVKKMGFSDVVALFGDDGSLDIVVKSQTLTSSQVAQITDIASRQANVSDLDKIHIKNIF